MMPQFLKRIFAAAVVWLLRRSRKLSVELLKIQAAIAYVRGVQTARAVTIVSQLVMALIVVFGAGVAFLPVGLAMVVYGYCGSLVAAGVTLLVIGALYVIVPLLLIQRVMSEPAWMRMFKADEVISNATQKPPAS